LLLTAVAGSVCETWPKSFSAVVDELWCAHALENISIAANPAAAAVLLMIVRTFI